MDSATGEPRDVLKHINALDGIRGVAILLVLCNHLLWSNSQTGSRVMDFVAAVRGAGWVGVDLFFALSGFLITGILFDSLYDEHYFRNFYARRILRIFPIYYGVICILFFVFRASSTDEKRAIYLLAAFLQNTPLWWNGVQKTTLIDISNHLWSLAVEEQFYLIWPLVVFWVKDRKKLLWFAAGMGVLAFLSRGLLLAHGAPFEATYKMTICRADSLLGGAWLALVIRGGSRKTVLKYALPVFWLGFGACCFLAWRSHGFDWEGSYSINLFGYSLLAITSTALVALALEPGSWLTMAMSGSVLRFFGRYSYGIYVYHQLVGSLMNATVTQSLRTHVHSKVLFHLASMTLVAGVTIPLAVLSFELYEKQFLKMRRFFNYGVASHRLRETHL